MKDRMGKTTLDIILQGSDFLAKHNIENPRLNVELLLCKVLNLQRIDLYLKHDMPLGKPEIELMRELLRRRAKHEPLQYLLEKQQFLDIELYINENVLIPRPETELLAKKAEELIEKRSYKKVLDIGTGSGCIAVYLAKKFPEIEIIALDKSDKALEVAKKNAEIYDVANIKFFQSDILKIKPKQRYDLVVSNPPYISQEEYHRLEPELSYEPMDALTDFSDGLTFYRRYAEIFQDILNTNGAFLLELVANSSQKIQEIFSKYKIDFFKDFLQFERILYGEVTK